MGYCPFTIAVNHNLAEIEKLITNIDDEDLKIKIINRLDIISVELNNYMNKREVNNE